MERTHTGCAVLCLCGHVAGLHPHSPDSSFHSHSPALASRAKSWATGNARRLLALPRISWEFVHECQTSCLAHSTSGGSRPAPPTPVPRSGSAHRSILPRVVANDPGAPGVPAVELADVVHLPVDHEPPLLVPGALRHLVPREVALGRRLGRGLGVHLGRGDQARAPGRWGSTRRLCVLGECTRLRAPGFQHPRRGPRSPDARAPIGRAAWRGEGAPAFPRGPAGED